MKDHLSYIVFVTEHADKVHLVFENLIRPSGFLLKPLSLLKYKEVFLSTYCEHSHLTKKTDYFSVTVGARYYKIPIHTICYFESSQKKILINTDTQVISAYDTLDAIGERLVSLSFIRCHKGFIVNLNKIEKIEYNEMLIHLNNGIQLPMSRTYKDVFKQVFPK